jgi:hypothetical protein
MQTAILYSRVLFVRMSSPQSLHFYSARDMAKHYKRHGDGVSLAQKIGDNPWYYASHCVCAKEERSERVVFNEPKELNSGRNALSYEPWIIATRPVLFMTISWIILVEGGMWREEPCSALNYKTVNYRNKTRCFSEKCRELYSLSYTRKSLLSTPYWDIVTCFKSHL